MKKFIAGAIFGAALMVGVTAYADVQGMVGKVVDGVFPVKIEGQTLENEAIVIEGTSYLPVRELAEKAGYEVSFDMEEGIGLKKEVPPVKESNSKEVVQDEKAIEEQIPALDFYRVKINALESLLDAHQQAGGDEDEAESYKQEIEQLKAEREKYYPDWNESE